MGLGTALFYGDLGKGFELSQKVKKYFEKNRIGKNKNS
jgi:hypothetical protein